MKKSDINNWLFGEAETAITNSTVVSVTDASGHVDIAESHADGQYPFVGLTPISTVTESAGLGNEGLYTAAEDRADDADDTLQSTTEAETKRYTVELGVRTDDRHAVADDLTGDLKTHFHLLSEAFSYPDNLPAEMISVSAADTAPQSRPEDFVRGTAIEVTVRYVTTEGVDRTAAETVTLDVTSQ